MTTDIEALAREALELAAPVLDYVKEGAKVQYIPEQEVLLDVHGSKYTIMPRIQFEYPKFSQFDGHWVFPIIETGNIHHTWTPLGADDLGDMHYDIKQEAHPGCGFKADILYPFFAHCVYGTPQLAQGVLDLLAQNRNQETDLNEVIAMQEEEITRLKREVNDNALEARAERCRIDRAEVLEEGWQYPYPDVEETR